MRYIDIIATTIAAATIAGAAAATPPAKPATPKVCALSDIGPAALKCEGFYAGNLVSGSPTDIAAQKTALGLLGYTFDGDLTKVDKISSLAGAKSVMFDTILKGISYVAFHFGGGQGGPGEATAFYKIDAGAELNFNTIKLNYSASSNAALYSTQTGPIGGGGGTVGAVPEPAAWAMMVAGFGLVGVARRRRVAVAAA